MRFPGKSEDEELDEEIRAHLEMAADEALRRGASPDAARAAARRDFGNVAHVKELAHEFSTSISFDRLVQDLRYAMRSLARSPSFAIVAVLTFALGIGATTAMFSVVRGILLRPLPFRDPDRLFAIDHLPAGPNNFTSGMFDFDFVRYRRETRTLAAVALYHTYPMSFVGAGDPERLPGARVTPGFLGVLGIHPSIGRDFEDTDDTAPVLLISDAVWTDRFGRDSAVLGRSIEVDGERRNVIGVLPAGFDFPSHARVWLPANIKDDNPRGAMPVIGRPRPGATREQVLAELSGWVTQIPAVIRRPAGERYASSVTPLRDVLVGDVRKPLLIFMAAVAFVLLIACANVMSLLLMRGASREHELSVRAVLGASRTRLVRQLLTEALVLALAGGLLGLGVAWAGVRALLASMPGGLLPRTEEIGIDMGVLLAMSAGCMATGLLFGLLPAIVESRRDARIAQTSGARVTRRLRAASALVVFETALALALLMGAGLVARSFLQLRSVDPGFKAEQVVMATVDLPELRYKSVDQLQRFAGDLTARLANSRGVRAAAAINWRPLDSTYIIGDFALPADRPLPPEYRVLKPSVTPDYFRVMGINVLSGRAFAPSDDARSQRVVVISRSFATQFWRSGDAVGQRLSVSGNTRPEDWSTIIGIVDDVVHDQLAKTATPAIYRPIAQTDNSFFLNHLTLLAQATGDPTSVLAVTRRVVREADPKLPLAMVTTMPSALSSSLAEPRFQMQLFGLFSVIALLLAVVGIYGVLAYLVAERKHEIGIRMALGASPADVRRMIVSRSLRMTIAGLGVGLIVSLGLTRALAGLLYHVTPTDPLTFACVVLLLLGVAVLTSLIPAARAARTDPLDVIRR